MNDNQVIHLRSSSSCEEFWAVVDLAFFSWRGECSKAEMLSRPGVLQVFDTEDEARSFLDQCEEDE